MKAARRAAWVTTALVLAGCGAGVRTVSELTLQTCLNRAGGATEFVDSLIAHRRPAPAIARAFLSGFDATSPWDKHSVNPQLTGVYVYVFQADKQARLVAKGMTRTAQIDKNVIWLDFTNARGRSQGPWPNVDRVVRRCVDLRSRPGEQPPDRAATANTLASREYYLLRSAAGDLADRPGPVAGLFASASAPTDDQIVGEILRITRGQPDSMRLPPPDGRPLRTFLAAAASPLRHLYPDLATVLVKRPRVVAATAYMSRVCAPEAALLIRVGRLNRRLNSEPLPTTPAEARTRALDYFSTLTSWNGGFIRLVRHIPPPLLSDGLTLSRVLVRVFTAVNHALLQGRAMIAAASPNDPYQLRSALLGSMTKLRHLRLDRMIDIRQLDTGDDNVPPPPSCLRLFRLEHLHPAPSSGGSGQLVSYTRSPA